MVIRSLTLVLALAQTAVAQTPQSRL